MVDNISTKLLKTQGFRGTICSVPEKELIQTELALLFNLKILFSLRLFNTFHS